jgi:hypothetical protein
MPEETSNGKVSADSMQGEHGAFVRKLAGEIRCAAEEMAWGLLGSLLDALAEAVIVALVERWDDAVAESYKAVEGALTGVIAFHKLHRSLPRRDQDPKGAEAAAGQLRAFTKLLSVALRHRSPPHAEEMVADRTSGGILEALQEAGGKATADELLAKMAKKPGMERDAISRALPMLRAAGLTDAILAGVVPTHRLLLAGQIALASRDMQPLGQLAVVRSAEARTELQAWLAAVRQPILDHATEIDHLVGSHLGTPPGYTLHINRTRPGQVTFQVSISGPPPDTVLLSD